MSDLIDHIATRARAAGLSPTADVIAGCAGYLALLAKWNRKMNLTALPVDPPGDAAIDRLIIEPLIGAHHIPATARSLVDLGSGGGSPAIPLRIAAPWVRRLTMVESREKKAAFLREAARALSLEGVTVEARRIEDLAPGHPVDLVSLRAIKVNDQISTRIAGISTTTTRVLWFRGPEEDSEMVGFTAVERTPLPGAAGEILVLARA